MTHQLKALAVQLGDHGRAGGLQLGARRRLGRLALLLLTRAIARLLGLQR